MNRRISTWLIRLVLAFTMGESPSPPLLKAELPALTLMVDLR